MSDGVICQVDDEDFEWARRFHWHPFQPKAHTRGLRRLANHTYVVRWVKGRRVLLHREAWQRRNGECPPMLDHRDRDSLNNQLSNLRPADAVQNQGNRGPSRVSKSGVKGVCWHKDKRKWRASIGEPTRHLGYFATIEEAARAYEAAAKIRYGEFMP